MGESRSMAKQWQTILLIPPGAVEPDLWSHRADVDRARAAALVPTIIFVYSCIVGGSHDVMRHSMGRVRLRRE